jgi:uncharacterized membrane protein
VEATVEPLPHLASKAILMILCLCFAIMNPMFNKYFWPMFVTVCLIGFLHAWAMEEAYYWTISWYDIMMHFLGGFWLALSILWINETKTLPFRMSLANVLFFVLVISALWELYELYFDMTFTSDPEYSFDTSLDFVMDTLGGLVAFLLMKISFFKIPNK